LPERRIARRWGSPVTSFDKEGKSVSNDGFKKNELKCFIHETFGKHAKCLTNETFGGSKWPLEKMGEVEELYAGRQGRPKKGGQSVHLKKGTTRALWPGERSNVFRKLKLN